MEDPRGDEPAVLGGRADVVDRVRARRRASRRRGRPSRASAAGPRGPPPSRGRGSAWRPPTRARAGRRSTARPALPSRQPSAMTTLLIDWARRVPTLRKRSSRPASSGIRMRSEQLVGRQRRLPVGRPELGGRDRPLAARRAEHERRVGGEQDRQRVAGRRRVDDVAAERPAVLDLGRTDRRGRLDQHGEMLATQRRPADLGVGRQRAEADRVAVERDAAQRIEPPQVEDARRAARPSSPVSATIRSVPPAIGRAGPSARIAYASASCARAGDGRFDRHRRSVARPADAAADRRRAGPARRRSRNRPRAASATRARRQVGRAGGVGRRSAARRRCAAPAAAATGCGAAAVGRDRDAIGSAAHGRLPLAAAAIASTILV